MNTKGRIISTEDGRELRISEAGQPDGVPILVHHGTPGSRLLNPAWVEDAKSRGIRLISYERPGYGGSTPQSGRNVASVDEDVAAIAKHLDLDRLSVWGVSGGGPHALACAALLPDLVVAAAALASPAPYLANGLDWFAGMGEDNIDEFSAALEGQDVLGQYIEAQAPGLLNADPKTLVQALHSLLCPIDVAVLTENFADFLLSSIREGIKERRDGWVDDDIAFTMPWGFELSQIRIPVMLMHGAQDQMVPFSHGKWLASRITNVDARLLADDGHLSLSARRIPDVHVWLLGKM
ncbi:MAG TPA: alpha/beta fold hydrolase [Pelolinea sp.]|nr:alpha/beta fold hydrolase [Pelolinea sp.]